MPQEHLPVSVTLPGRLVCGAFLSVSWLTAAIGHAAMGGCFPLPNNRQVSELMWPYMGPGPCATELSDVLSSVMVLEKLLRYIILYILPVSPYCFT